MIKSEELELHKKWLLSHGEEGQRLNKKGADLEGADLRGAILRGAILRNADLEGADLRDADLEDADLEDADLQDAILRRANLHGADLEGAILRGADLELADLEGADLEGADLCVAILRGAILRGTYLRRAYLESADLRGAYLEGATLPHFQIPDGDLVVWKKVEGEIVKLRIREEFARTASLVGRKCRASAAEVLEVEGGTSVETRGVVYAVGEVVYPDAYDDDIRIECTHGIHFFLTREEAEEWMV